MIRMVRVHSTLQGQEGDPHMGDLFPAVRGGEGGSECPSCADLGNFSSIINMSKWHVLSGIFCYPLISF